MTLSLRIAFAMVVMSAGLACRGAVTQDTPLVPIRNMYHQARYDSQEVSTFFEDGRTMRPPVEGTLAVEMDPNLSHATGRTEDDASWLLTVPQAIVERHGGMEQTIARGQDRFNIYCTPCHGVTGDGHGLVADRAAAIGAATLQPPVHFTDERIRTMPDGQLYATLTNGIRNMPAYRHAIPQDDRWAIVMYVRALQLANPPVNDSTEDAQ